MRSLIDYIFESNNELSNILKNISKNDKFIKLLNDNDYEYSLNDPPSKDELIDGLCDFVDYFIYDLYGDKYKYYNLSNGHNAHWIIYDPSDKLYKDGYDYNGKSNWKLLKWFKNLDKSSQNGIKLEELEPELP